METPAWKFYLFAGLRILHEKFALPAPSERASNLLVFLLLNPRPLSRTYLIGSLFPDLPESTGRRRLSDLLWLLRRDLPDLPLQTDAKQIFLPGEARWLDVEAFCKIEASSDPNAWRTAIELYQGELLPGNYSEWLLLERENLHLRCVRLLHRAADEFLKANNLGEALTLLQKLVQMEPLDEPALRQLMRAYAQLGQRGAALAAYERYTYLAAHEMGLEPDAATQSMAQSMIDHPFAPAVAVQSFAGMSREQLREEAYLAIRRGDQPRFLAAYGLLCANSLQADPLSLHLLELDFAIQTEAYAKAEEILAGLDADLASVRLRQARLALAQRRLETAQQLASRLLLEAVESGDRSLELESLLALAQNQLQLGDPVQAVTSAARALRLAEKTGSPVGKAEGLLVQGKALYREGRLQEALSIYHQARSLTHEHGLNIHLAHAAHGLFVAQLDQGAFSAARENIEEELRLWRDLNLPRKEASALHNLSILLGQIGENEQAIRQLELADQIHRRLNDAHGIANNQYHLAAGLAFADESQLARSITLAEQALGYFRAAGDEGMAAATLYTLGYNLIWMQQYERAQTCLEESFELFEQLSELYFLPEIASYLGLALLGQNCPEQALERTRQALLLLAQSSLENDILSEILYVHALVLRANGRTDEAISYIRRAYENLLDYAETIEEEDARQAFFQRDPTVRRLMQEVTALDLAPAPEGKIVRQWVKAKGRTGERLVSVKWTLDAGPADDALRRSAGAVALRRTRLARLLREAKAQGAEPSIQQLAELFDVSPRTLKRDLSVLRRIDKAS